MKCNEATQGYCANADQDGNCYNVDCEAYREDRRTEMLITLTNDFHNTEVRVRVDRLPAALSERQTKRVISALCGMSDCHCGIIRGPQEHDGHRLVTEWDQNQQGGYNLLIWEEEN